MNWNRLHRMRAGLTFEAKANHILCRDENQNFTVQLPMKVFSILKTFGAALSPHDVFNIISDIDPDWDESNQNDFANIIESLISKSLLEEYPITAGRHSYLPRLRTTGFKDGDALIRLWDVDEGSVEIGHYCSIADNTQFFLGDGGHRTHTVSTYGLKRVLEKIPFTEDPFYKTDPAKIVIGNDVWIGAESMIQAGVTIGNGAVLAARSNVMFDVPPYAVVAGNPAKVVRFRFDARTIEKLQSIAWWNWDEEKIIENMDLFYDDVQSFIKKHEKQNLSSAKRKSSAHTRESPNSEKNDLSKMEKTLCDFLNQKLSNGTKITPSTPLITSGLIRSVTLFELLAFVESELEIDIPPEDISEERFETVNRISSYLQDFRSKKP